MKFEDDDMRFEQDLKRAFKAEDPGEAFTRRVLDRVRQDAARRETVSVPTPAFAANSRTRTNTNSNTRSGMNWRVTLAFAASLLIAVGGATWVRHVRYIEEGERARAQVLMAMRVTSEKLNVVRSTVNELQDAH